MQEIATIVLDYPDEEMKTELYTVLQLAAHNIPIYCCNKYNELTVTIAHLYQPETINGKRVEQKVMTVKDTDKRLIIAKEMEEAIK